MLETKPNDILVGSVEVPDSVAERRLLWKLDLNILPILYLLYITVFIDRSNIGNVKIEGGLGDLKMVGNDFNIALMAHSLPFIVLELPSSLALRSRRWRPGTWMGCMAAGWGIATIGCGFTKSFGGLVACRFLVGCFGAGFIPSCAYLMSQYYRRFEFQRRYAVIFTASQIGGVFGGFLAYAIEKMNYVGWYAGWRWWIMFLFEVDGWEVMELVEKIRIFIIEGLITICIAFAAYFLVVPLPEDAGFLDRDEKAFLLEVLKEDDNNSAEEMPLMIMEILKIARSWKVVLPMLCHFASTISAAAISAFQPTIMKTMGYTASEAQIHTIPVYMAALVFTLVTSGFSDRLRIRSPFLLLGLLFSTIGFLISFLSIPHINPRTGLGFAGPRYASLFLIAIGEGVAIPSLVCWVANNARTRKERVVGLAVMVGGAQFGTLVSANVFVTGHTAGGFRMGFGTGVGVSVMGILAGCGLAGGLWWENWRLGKGAERGGGEGERGVRNTL